MRLTPLFLLIALIAGSQGQDTPCVTDDGQTGSCVDYRYYECHAGVVQGICPGDSNIRCCLDCDSECQAEEDNYDRPGGEDEQCEVDGGGECLPTSNYCDKGYNTNLGCGDPATRACCGGIYAPDTEFRAMFVATAFNVDFPSGQSDSTDSQQAQLDALVDAADGINFNAIMFQVRPASDAVYDSDIEPWSEVLTGSQGTAPNPYYDPLDYIISAAHAKGIEVHAWLNPYRGSTSGSTSALSSDHICNTLPQYCYYYDPYLWLDPGAAPVQDRLIEVITDIVSRYDVDGIHFDDYFYPYPNGNAFPDSATYAEYQANGGTLALADWRRDNVNRMVQRVYDTVHGIKSSVRFSISPFGLYKPGDPNNGGMPSSIVGLDPYSELYADSKYWLQQGWVDFLAPQLYWRIDPPEQSYPVLLDWWISDEVNTADRHIYAANAVYNVDSSEQNWPTSEIIDQINISRDEARRTAFSLGNVLYSATVLKNNEKGIADSLREICPAKVSTPSYSWLSTVTRRDLRLEGVVVEGRTITVEMGEKAERWRLYRVREGHAGLMALEATLPRWMGSFEVSEEGTYAVVAVDAANVAGQAHFFRV